MQYPFETNKETNITKIKTEKCEIDLPFIVYADSFEKITTLELAELIQKIYFAGFVVGKTSEK